MMPGDRRTLQRNLGPVAHLTPGEWTSSTASGRPAVCCPTCGGLDEIEFGVHTGGVVSQIWSCPWSRCDLVAYLTLANWNDEVVPA